MQLHRTSGQFSKREHWLGKCFCVDTRKGIFPDPPQSSFNCFPPLPMSFLGRDCHQAMQGFESVEVSAMHYPAWYEFPIHKSGGILQWAIVVGYGIHSHSVNFPRPSPWESRRTISLSLKYNSSATVEQLTEEIVGQFGCRNILVSIRRHRFNKKAQSKPTEKHVLSLKSV